MASAWAACVVNTRMDAELTIHLNQPGATVSPTLYGAFFKDINRASPSAGQVTQKFLNKK